MSMDLSIRNGGTEAAVRRLAHLNGLGLTEAIDLAVRDRLALEDGSSGAVARLTLGDVFTYALAATENEPVLWTGDEFARTSLTALP